MPFTQLEEKNEAIAELQRLLSKAQAENKKLEAAAASTSDTESREKLQKVGAGLRQQDGKRLLLSLLLSVRARVPSPCFRSLTRHARTWQMFARG